MTAIQEAKDLSILPFDDLIGSLIAYEAQLESQRKLKSEKTPKRKELTLKAKVRDSASDSDKVGPLNSEEYALLTKSFKRILQRRKGKSQPNKLFSTNVTCFNCVEKGHIKKDCLQPSSEERSEGSQRKNGGAKKCESKFKRKEKFEKAKKEKKIKGKKASVATWDDKESSSGSSSESEHEVANVCLMVNENLDNETCRECGQLVKDCPICRGPIQIRIRLY